MDRPLVEFTGLDLKAACDRIEAETEGRTGSVNAPGLAMSNRLVAQVSAVWRAADRLHELPGRNPATKVTTHRLKPKTERIPDEEFPAWFARVRTLPAVRRDFQLLCLFTGLRSESARFIRWDDVDWKRRVLHVRRAKGNRPYTVPLGRTCLDMLKRRQKENASLFGAYGGDQGLVLPALSRAHVAVTPGTEATVEKFDEQVLGLPGGRGAGGAPGAGGPGGRGRGGQGATFRVQPIAEAKERRVNPETGVLEKYLPGPHPLRKTYNSVAIEIGIPKHDREALMNHEGQGVNVRHYGFPENWDHLAECQAKIEAALWKRLRGARGRRKGGAVTSAVTTREGAATK